MSVRIHIERLVLDGLPLSPADGPRLRAAVAAELARLVAAGGLSPAVLASARLRGVAGGPLRVAEGGTAGELGTGIARAVYVGIGQ
jgi:hypothetical protein